MIEVVHDGEGLAYREQCCFCDQPTNYWCTEKDVAVCQTCASTHTVAQVPSKKAWCDRVRRQWNERARASGWPISR